MAGEHILVIDDSETHRELMVLTLETMDYWVDTAKDGLEGIKKVMESPPDLVLLDLTMEGIDGFDVCQRLKSRSETRFVPIILLTTSQATVDKTRGLEVGADDYLLKGIDGRELDARIQWVLARYRRGLTGDPVTKLPGATAVIAEVRDRLSQNKKFGIVFLSIKGFGEYVSNYGYTQGNDVLIRVSNVIRDVVSDNDQADDYIASLGSEKFSILSSVNSTVGLAERLVDRLNQLLPEAYNESDRNQGYVEVKNRKGNSQQHNLMVPIAAIVSNETRQFEHPEEVFRVGNELLRHIKTLKDKNVMKDRRRN